MTGFAPHLHTFDVATRSKNGDTHSKVPLIAALITGGAAVLAALIGAVASGSDKEHTPPRAAALPATISFPPGLECDAGTQSGDIINSAVFVVDRKDQGTTDHKLDFGPMNGSAWHNERDGRTYYWGRAGRDDVLSPPSGGTYLRWRTATLAWHTCRKPLLTSDSDYVRTEAVADTIAGEDTTIQVCVWMDRWEDQTGKLHAPGENCVTTK